MFTFDFITTMHSTLHSDFISVNNDVHIEKITHKCWETDRFNWSLLCLGNNAF